SCSSPPCSGSATATAFAQPGARRLRRNERPRPNRCGAMPRRRSARKLVDLWVGIFRRDNLVTYASAIAFRALVALVALVLLTIAVLGEIGRTDVWTRQIGPHIKGK